MQAAKPNASRANPPLAARSLEVILIIHQEGEKGELSNLDAFGGILLTIVSIEEDVLVARDVEDGPREVPFALPAPIHRLQVPPEIGRHEGGIAVAAQQIDVVAEFRIGPPGVAPLVLVQ